MRVWAFLLVEYLIFFWKAHAAVLVIPFLRLSLAVPSIRQASQATAVFACFVDPILQEKSYNFSVCNLLAFIA